MPDRILFSSDGNMFFKANGKAQIIPNGGDAADCSCCGAPSFDPCDCQQFALSQINTDWDYTNTYGCNLNRTATFNGFSNNASRCIWSYQYNYFGVRMWNLWYIKTNSAISWIPAGNQGKWAIDGGQFLNINNACNVLNNLYGPTNVYRYIFPIEQQLTCNGTTLSGNLDAPNSYSRTGGGLLQGDIRFTISAV